MQTLGDLAVICELKVGSSAGGGLDHREVAQDIYKLGLLLEQADRLRSATASRLCMHLRQPSEASLPTGGFGAQASGGSPRPPVSQILLQTDRIRR